MKHIRISCSILLAVGLCACRTVPSNIHIESGRARTLDDRGARQSRINAAARAQQDARMRMLQFVEAMAAGDSNLVGDYMAQNPVLAARIRAIIHSARQYAARYYEDGAVEVDVGIDPEDVLRVVREIQP